MVYSKATDNAYETYILLQAWLEKEGFAVASASAADGVLKIETETEVPPDLLTVMGLTGE